MKFSRRALLLLTACLVGPSCGSGGGGGKSNLPAAAPTTLVATAATTARIDLTWVDNADNEGVLPRFLLRHTPVGVRSPDRAARSTPY